jgi:radical SAM protein with 4Fe4S-binding SPASM domain
LGLPFPRTVWIVPTTRCNTKCVTCAHAYSDFGRDMPSEVFETIDRELLDHVTHVNLVGVGEPLISRTFPAMLEACFRRGIHVSFFTNTIVLTEDLARLAVANDAHMVVSLDASTPETNRLIRPYLALNRILDKLEMVRRVRASHPTSRFKLTTNTVVMRRNLLDLPGIVDLAARYGIDAVVYSDLIPHEMDPAFAAESLVDEPALAIASLAEAAERARRLGVNISIPAHYAPARQSGPAGDRPADLRVAPKSRIYPQRCRLPWTHASIDVDGRVSTCCIATTSLGNLSEHSFGEIWNGEAYDQTRRSIDTNNPPADCRHCNLIEGITAGDPCFFDTFLSRNRCAVEADGVEIPHADVREVARALETTREARIRLCSSRAQFLLMRAPGFDSVRGSAAFEKEGAREFVFNGGMALIDLPEALGERDVDLTLRVSAPVVVTSVECLVYDYRAPDLDNPANAAVLEGAQPFLATIRERVRQAAATTPAPRTAMVFGANAAGRVARRILDDAGLEFLGYLDNFTTKIDGLDVRRPTALQTSSPDVVVVASKVHAPEMAREVLEWACRRPIVITGTAAGV